VVWAVKRPKSEWTLEVFTTDDGFEPFVTFADELSDVAFAALDAALQHVLVVRGIDLAGTEWLRPLGQGLHEFRVRHAADEIARMFATGRPTKYLGRRSRSCCGSSSTSMGSV
jgi:hypothetical protein